MLCLVSKVKVTKISRFNINSVVYKNSYHFHIQVCQFILIKNNNYFLIIIMIFSALEEGRPITVVYVPGHLHHMVFELLKVTMNYNRINYHFLQGHEIHPSVKDFQAATRLVKS